MKKRYLILLAGLLILALGIVRLSINNNNTPSEASDYKPQAMIGKKVPDFSLPDLFDPNKRVSPSAMKGKVWLINVCMSNILYCVNEQALFNYLAEYDGIIIVGIDLNEAEKAKKNLVVNGNPFAAVGSDPEYHVFKSLRVIGFPVTYLIDQEGIVRWVHESEITQEIWKKELKPLFEKYQEMK